MDIRNKLMKVFKNQAYGSPLAKYMFLVKLVMCVLIGVLLFLVVDWKMYPYSDQVSKASYALKRNIVALKNNIDSNGLVGGLRRFKFGDVYDSDDKFTIFGLKHHIIVERFDFRKELLPYFENGSRPPGYLATMRDGRILVIAGDGKNYIFEGANLRLVDSNLPELLRNQNYRSINQGVDLSKRLGIKGIFYDNSADRVYVAYHKRKSGGCYSLGIDYAGTNGNKYIFKEFFKSNACAEDFNGHESGGRLSKLEDDIVLTHGSFDNTDSKVLSSLDNHLGSVLKINPDREAQVIAKGMRNQQGLIVVNGEVFITSHGPMGGDIFTAVKQGDNFGWPTHSYGFDYTHRDSYQKPMRPNFTEPTYYFTPSIAIAPVIFYSGDMFPRFKNTFIVGALKDKSIHILDFDFHDSRVKSVERYDIGYRIRDISFDREGLIYLLTDEGFLLKLRRAASDMTYNSTSLQIKN